MAELAYAHDSGSCPRKWVRVQVPSTALNVRAENVEESMFLALFLCWKLKRQKADIQTEAVTKGEKIMNTDPTKVVYTIGRNMKISATTWLIIGIAQIIVGLPELFVGYGVACIGLGIWNIVQSTNERNLANRFLQYPVGLYDYYYGRNQSIILSLVVNLIFGSVIGAIGAFVELSIRNYVIAHRNELMVVEASIVLK